MWLAVAAALLCSNTGERSGSWQCNASPARVQTYLARQSGTLGTCTLRPLGRGYKQMGVLSRSLDVDGSALPRAPGPVV